MKETIILPLSYKIIRLNNLRTLADFIYNLKLESELLEGNFCDVSYRAYTEKGSIFEDSSPKIFSEDSPTSHHRISKIHIAYYEKLQNKSIHISLMHGSIKGLSQIEVSGNDSTWVHGKVSKISNLIDSFPPQSVFLKKWQSIIEIVLFTGIGALFFNLVGIISNSEIWQAKTKPEGFLFDIFKIIYNFLPMRYILKYSFYYFFGAVLGSEVFRKLHELWPSIELQIGPEHTYIEKKRRNFIVVVFFAGVLPLLVNVIYDILKIII